MKSPTELTARRGFRKLGARDRDPGGYGHLAHYKRKLTVSKVVAAELLPETQDSCITWE